MKNRTDITIYLKRYSKSLRDDEWHCFHIGGAMWFNGQRSTLTNTKYNKIIVRVFLKDLLFASAKHGENYAMLLNEKGDLFLREGDVVLQGIFTDAMPQSAKEKTDNFFSVQTITDNRKGAKNMHHYRIGGV